MSNVPLLSEARDMTPAEAPNESQHVSGKTLNLRRKEAERHIEVRPGLAGFDVVAGVQRVAAGVCRREGGR